MIENVKETKDFLESKLAGFKPEVALVVGSGLGGITQSVTKPVVISYTDIPHFPKPTVAGHAGQMIFGELAGKKLMVLSGRFHYYEGRSLAEIIYPIHVVDALGVKALIVTNAAGGINPQYKPGDLMVIEDHINFMGVNPLIGGVNGNGVKFIDMSQTYSPRLREKLDAAAEKLQIPIWRGVYLATTGPNYETPAEIKAFAWIGADAVGMSTVPEVIIARYHNIEIAGISCITNLAAGISSKKLSHDEVLEVGRASQEKLAKLLTEFAGML
jgi:purine-nucleoside phosphorylase